MHFPSLGWIVSSLYIVSRVSAIQFQLDGLTLPSDAEENKATVLNLFTTSYNAYKKYAFGHDDLTPVSESFVDELNGWGATIVDAMGAMVIMGLDDDFEQAVNFSSQINFNTSLTDDTVSVFEHTIRFVGGFLSAYELSGKKYPVLVERAKALGDKLVFAWADNADIPFGYLNFTTNTPINDTTNIAEAGTLTLEYSRLSLYTGNSTYGDLAVKSVRHIAGLATPLPALAPQIIDPVSGDFADAYITWGGGSDSYFEYLIKYARLTNTDDTVFADTWHTAVDSSIKTLLKTSTVGDFSYLADYDDTALIRHVGSHLACFYAGNWMLGGKLLQNDTIVEVALKLNDACWNTYAGTETGIGPEAFAFISDDGNFTGPGNTITADQLQFYNEHGYYITTSDYILRPEVLESNFYAYRMTGNQTFLDRAAAAIASFEKFLPTTVAWTGIEDVNSPDSAKIDDMESFWFAEVLKYLYLTFDDPSHISLDEWVFNTEGHPLSAPASLDSYGSGNLIQQQGSFTLKESALTTPTISLDAFRPVSTQN